MFMVNTYRWDYAQVAALVAPRPLLISNTDKDDIFPLDGVVKVHEQVRRIYRLYGAEDKLGLQITEGPHKDTQELHIHEFVWMNKFLKGEDPPIDVPATKLFEPTQLRVFDDLPQPERNSSIDETFVPAASAPSIPQDSAEWTAMRERWLKDLREKCFRAWPADSPNDALTLDIARNSLQQDGDLSVASYDFTSQPPYRLPMLVIRREGDIKSILLKIADEKNSGVPVWELLTAKSGSRLTADAVRAEKLAQAYNLQPGELLCIATPRGIGPTEWTRDEKERIHIRRRFMLLGQTDHSARVYDVRRAIQAVRQLAGTDVPLTLKGEHDAAVWAIYASLFEPNIAQLSLQSVPAGHREGPDFLNVLRILDIPQAAAMAEPQRAN
jgi:hypothetical protein